MALDLNSAELREIASHYEAPRETWVRANMVISQDGHFVGPNNTSRDLTGPADLKLLLLLRALSDVILVGANTARHPRPVGLQVFYGFVAATFGVPLKTLQQGGQKRQG